MIDERERVAAPLTMRKWCLEEEGLYGAEREREREGQQCSRMLWREKEIYQWRAELGIYGERKGRERMKRDQKFVFVVVRKWVEISILSIGYCSEGMRNSFGIFARAYFGH